MPLFLDGIDTKNHEYVFGGAKFEMPFRSDSYITYNANEHKDLIISAIDEDGHKRSN